MKTDRELPWYRQFWPWFLIVLPTVVILACLYTIWLALDSPLSLVKKDYYQEGLTINQDRTVLQRASELGLTMQLNLVDHAAALQLAIDSHGQPFDTADVIVIELHHPMDASKDLLLSPAHVAPGRYQVMLDPQMTIALQTEARWYLVLEGRQQGETLWRLQDEWPVSSHD